MEKFLKLDPGNTELLAMAVIATFFFLVHQKKKIKAVSEEFTRTIWDTGSSDERTEIIGVSSAADREGGMVLIWDQEAKYQAVLTGVNSPNCTLHPLLIRNTGRGCRKAAPARLS